MDLPHRMVIYGIRRVYKRLIPLFGEFMGISGPDQIKRMPRIPVELLAFTRGFGPIPSTRVGGSVIL